jgi:hypothetical protein
VCYRCASKQEKKLRRTESTPQSLICVTRGGIRYQTEKLGFGGEKKEEEEKAN